MPLLPGNSAKVKSYNIGEMIRSGHPRGQSIAAAYSNARRHPKSSGGIGAYAGGGAPSPKGMVQPGNLDAYNRKVLHNPDGSYSTASTISIGTDKGEVLIPTVVDGQRLSSQDAIAHYRKTGENFGTFSTPSDADAFAVSLHNSQAAQRDKDGTALGIGAYSHGGPVIEKGFLASDGAGRTDNLAITVPHGAHVIPADVISVLGQGNSASGAKHLREALDHLGAREHHAKGGKTGNTHTPILAAGGEFIVSPAEVNAIGKGDQKKGHDALDAMIVSTRKAGAKRMLKLKGPKR